MAEPIARPDWSHAAGGLPAEPEAAVIIEPGKERWRLLTREEWEQPIKRLEADLYWIVDEHGKARPFRLNDAQRSFLTDIWYLECILKSRQHGFSTLIQLLMLDQCIFNENTAAGVIAHGLREAQAIFRNKIKFAYDKLPPFIRSAVYPTTNSTVELILSNGSRLHVGTSMRSDTLQLLHVSEFGKICARFPEKAREIVTGAFNTVHSGQWIFVESTAEGMHGPFYELCQRAEKLKLSGTKESALDFRFHFYAWWMDAKNQLDPEGVPIPEAMARYFADLVRDSGIKLTPSQKAWYVKKAESQGSDMKREHPSTPQEAFEGAIEGAIYADQMRFLRGNNRIRSVPWVPSERVNTFWDLGRGNATSLWFHQYIAAEHRFIRYHENSGKDLAYFVKYMQDVCRGYIWGDHYLPHDGDNENLERGESRVDRLEELGLDNIQVIERIEDVGLGIELTRKAMVGPVYMDIELCSEGVKCLDNYHYEWDEKHGCWRGTPAKTWANNGADAFRQWAQGWDGSRLKKSGKRKKARSWRTT